MPLATNYTDIFNLRVDLEFNLAEADVDGSTKFRPLTIRASGQATTSDGGRKDVVNISTVGNLTNNPLTAKQIYTQLGNVTNMHTRLQNALKALYQSAISEDISV